MVEAELLSQISTIVATVVLVGGLLLASVKWLSGQSEKKASNLKEETDARAEELNSQFDKTVQELKYYTDLKYDTMIKNLSIVDEKVMEMLDDLRKRADLTNGNVSNIRTDILDLQEEIEELQSHDLRGYCEHDDNARIKSSRSRKRRLKRTQIESDRKSQHYI